MWSLFKSQKVDHHALLSITSFHSNKDYYYYPLDGNGTFSGFQLTLAALVYTKIV